MELQILGAIKIKDGLFLGDEFAAQDLDFLISNKVTHIINCAGKQVPNLFEAAGILYLTFNWQESDTQIIFDEKDEVLRNVINFMELARCKAESVLVHCVQGLSRSCCVLAAYFMTKFKWNLYKTLEFLHSRRPDLEIRASFFQQLNRLESKLVNKGIVKYGSWDELNVEKEILDEEIIIRNTFLNAKISKYEGKSLRNFDKRKKIHWIDEVYKDRNKLVSDIRPKSSGIDRRINNKYRKQPKSILKQNIEENNKSFFNNVKTNNDLIVQSKNPLSSKNKNEVIISNSLNFIEDDSDTERDHSFLTSYYKSKDNKNNGNNKINIQNKNQEVDRGKNNIIRSIPTNNNIRSSSLPKNLEEKQKNKNLKDSYINRLLKNRHNDKKEDYLNRSEHVIKEEEKCKKNENIPSKNDSYHFDKYLKDNKIDFKNQAEYLIKFF